MDNNGKNSTKFLAIGGVYFLLFLQWLYMSPDVTGIFVLLFGMSPSVLVYFHSAILLFSIFIFYLIGKHFIKKVSKVSFIILAISLAIVWAIKLYISEKYYALLATEFSDLSQAANWMDYNTMMGIPITVISILICILFLLFPFTKYFKD